MNKRKPLYFKLRKFIKKMCGGISSFLKLAHNTPLCAGGASTTKNKLYAKPFKSSRLAFIRRSFWQSERSRYRQICRPRRTEKPPIPPFVGYVGILFVCSYSPSTSPDGGQRDRGLPRPSAFRNSVTPKRNNNRNSFRANLFCIIKLERQTVKPNSQNGWFG